MGATVKEEKVAIVLVNYNGFDHSCACLDSLLTLSCSNYLIIFVDNGSTDDSGVRVRERYGDKISYSFLKENGGVTRGNNEGISYARRAGCAYVLFLNNDTEVEPDFLNFLLASSRELGNALVVPKIICADNHGRLDHWVGSDYDWWRCRPVGHKVYPLDGPEYDKVKEIKVSSTCCLLVPMPVIEAIGTMDENYFMYYDDSDFTLRASRAGYQMFYEPKARIYHKGAVTSTTCQPTYFYSYLLFRNTFYFYRKLCPDPVAQWCYLSYLHSRVFLSYVKSVIVKDAGRVNALRLLLEDIRSGRMGGVPKGLFKKG